MGIEAVFDQRLPKIRRDKDMPNPCGSIKPERGPPGAFFLLLFVLSGYPVASFVAGASASFAWNAGPFAGRLSTMLENAFDRQYTLVEGYPMPPRHLRLRLALHTR